DEVVETAEVPIGVPLIQVDTDEVADRVRALPDVGDVEIRRSWPQTLTIDVQPREALAVIRDGGTWWSVDSSGVLFDRADAPADGVPELDAPTEESAELARATGVAVLTGLPSSIEELVDSVEVESAADVRLTLSDGVTVRWGTAERGEDKARVLLALMEQRQEDDADPPETYDVSAPDHPAVVP
ncbi:cell division protein FtsQ/DivIB, partial [Phytoactinopolyspora endophytica]|uniref:cell division protein FtsQ/DivIB n=1 Tax=Phytoactinopolyspora endophytica TaxID=1642495 RepID=UPI00197C18C8